MRNKYIPISVGDRKGRWLITSVAAPVFYSGYAHRQWLCRCDCGTERIVKENSLQTGKSSSCGCLTRERASIVNTTHGKSQDCAEYRSWQAMLQRCHNPNYSRYADYGGRGIVVCEKWRLSFEDFLADVGAKPSDRHSIDRIKNDRGYEPGNCRWSLPHEQMTNRRNTFLVAMGEEKVPLSDLARKHQIPANTLRARIVAGWPIERALTQPVRFKS